MKTQSREIPLLMSAPMVLATLSYLKTETRRVVKFREFGRSDTPGYEWKFRGTRRGSPKSMSWQDLQHAQLLELCPYGKAGYRLWVRESWTLGSIHATTVDNGYGLWPETMSRPHVQSQMNPKCHNVIFRSDGEYVSSTGERERWFPSIHMPRWASRLDLQVREIRVEQLQDITEEGCKAEGLRCWSKDGTVWRWGPAVRHKSGEIDPVWPWLEMPHSAREAFAKLWESINGIGAWAVNPWVWVVAFNRMAKAERKYTTN